MSKQSAGWLSGPQGLVAAGLAALGAQQVKKGVRYYQKGRNKRPRSSVGKIRRGTYKKGRYRKKRRVQPGFKQRRMSTMQKLKRRSEQGLGTYIHKKRDSDRAHTGGVNQILYKEFACSTKTKIEDVIDSLPVFNPAVPGTFTFVDFTDGAQQKQVEIASTFAMLRVKNNRTLDCMVKIYIVSPKFDTDITPSTAITNGLADVGGLSGGGALVATTPMLTPLDSPQFRDAYKILKTQRKLLHPGQTTSVRHMIGSFLYDPSLSDSHGLENQQRNGTFYVLIRVEGDLCHDATAANDIGRSVAGVDMEFFVKTTVKYEAGADISYIEVDDNNEVPATGSSTFSTNPTIETFL